MENMSVPVPTDDDEMTALTEAFQALHLTTIRRPMMAAEILPLEMWEQIFLKLGPLDADDVYAVTNTTSVWGELLHPRKTLMLFPLIADLLQREKLLTPRDMLRCRQVCQTWKRGVDKFEASHPYFQNQIVEHPLAIRIPRFPVVIPFGPEFAGRKQVNVFSREMRHHTGNPFVSRSVTFSQKRASSDGLKLFYRNVTLLLRKFGGHIWELGVSGYITLSQLRQLLTGIPNVRTIRLLADFEMAESNSQASWTKLPALPHLVSVQTPCTLDERVSRLLLKSYTPKPKSNKKTRAQKRDPDPDTIDDFEGDKVGEPMAECSFSSQLSEEEEAAVAESSNSSSMGLPPPWSLSGLQLNIMLKTVGGDGGQFGDVLVTKRRVIGRGVCTEYYYSPMEQHRRHADHTFYFLPETDERLQLFNVKLFKTRLKVDDELLEKLLRFKLTGTQELVILMETHSSDEQIEESSQHALTLIAKFHHLQRVVLDVGRGNVVRLPNSLPDFHKWKNDNGIISSTSLFA